MPCGITCSCLSCHICHSQTCVLGSITYTWWVICWCSSLWVIATSHLKPSMTHWLTILVVSVFCVVVGQLSLANRIFLNVSPRIGSYNDYRGSLRAVWVPGHLWMIVYGFCFFDRFFFCLLFSRDTFKKVGYEWCLLRRPGTSVSSSCVTSKSLFLAEKLRACENSDIKTSMHIFYIGREEKARYACRSTGGTQLTLRSENGF